MQQHHYLGCEHYANEPVGEHLKYLVWARGGRPVAALAWSSAPRHLGARDRYIGWSQPARQRNLHRIAYNTRFLILPWVQVPHLASHILGRMAARISADWEAQHSASALSAGDLCRSAAISRNLLSGGELESAGGDDGTWQSRSHAPAEPFHQASAGAALAAPLEFVHFDGEGGTDHRLSWSVGMGLRPAKFREKLRQAQGIPGCSGWFFDPVMPRKTLAGVAAK
jgi:hypothetical protein